MIERNDPCWCGSGKKYKKCHLIEDQKDVSKPGRKSSKLLKSQEEIQKMRAAGAFNGQLMDYIR
ncbi:MAG: methionine aminopeptidase, partial [Fibrobacter sp.]|nr:methionine aminopeptidase [Fibrobacter sp.]